MNLVHNKNGNQHHTKYKITLKGIFLENDENWCLVFYKTLALVHHIIRLMLKLKCYPGNSFDFNYSYIVDDTQCMKSKLAAVTLSSC
jgi:hypothetical protein